MWAKLMKKIQPAERTFLAVAMSFAVHQPTNLFCWKIAERILADEVGTRFAPTLMAGVPKVWETIKKGAGGSGIASGNSWRWKIAYL